jgi:hypothetical protein
MPAVKTAKVRMLGNYQELEVGQTYDLPIERANQLTGIGFAVVVEDAAPAPAAGKE